ncbi:hypothetical protein HDU97_000760 [Phlyctochytrium planicorne]|nr:hypothetical protein HDU97_000760 [Phlyctochytrium planicorne]
MFRKAGSLIVRSLIPRSTIRRIATTPTPNVTRPPRIPTILTVAAATTLVTVTTLGIIACESPASPPSLTFSGTVQLPTGPLNKKKEPALESWPVYDGFVKGDGKKKLVVLGTGWGAISVIKSLEKEGFDVCVVSPSNYFLFSPLLPEAATGTVEARSLMESARKICSRLSAKFLEAEALDIDFASKHVQVVSRCGKHRFAIPYDKVVVAVGATNNTFGVPGVEEHTHFLKDINQARAIRYKVMSLFEEAALPMSDEERKKLLTFVIAGGGPTGIEFAAQLHDLIDEDIKKYFPDLKADVKLIHSSDHVLNTFAEAISSMTERHFKRNDIDVLLNARVVAVEKNKIIFKKKNVPKGEKDTFEIPFGLCVWSTGIGMRPFSAKLQSKIPAQNKSRALKTDENLQLVGVEDVYALGDCATVENPRLMDVIKQRLNETKKDKLNKVEFESLAKELVARYPQTALHLEKVDKLFEKYDADKSGFLDLDEIKTLLVDVDKKLTSFPATAQVASQQGKYLAKQLSSWAKSTSEFKPTPFKYNHLGSFSYIGADNAVMDLKGVSAGGIGVFLLWRSAFLSEQVSLRTRVLLAMDWLKCKVFGRDISRS